MAGAKNPEITHTGNQHSFASLLAELKSELVQFVRTRAQLLFSELQDLAGPSKKIAIWDAVALIFGGMAFLLFTVAAVRLVTLAFSGSPFAFFWGFLIVGICYLLLGAITAIVAAYGLGSLAPRKTIRVLHDDKAWVHAEFTHQS